MNPIRVGVIGCGVIGQSHVKHFGEGSVPGARLTALCDPSPEQCQAAAEALDEKVATFAKVEDLYESGQVDAVIIATPHYQHPSLAIAAFEHGLHVLIEKPSGAYTKQVRAMNAAAAASDNVFAIMFQNRIDPVQHKAKEMIDAGELGDLKRILWNRTHWYRPQSYYGCSSWRATWAGEGGAVLINQCSHDLDQLQWICGMPSRVRAFCRFGQYHDIETEDDCTAYMEYPSGTTCTFIASTGEAPGVNRVEIIGDKGKLLVENGQIEFWRNKISERQFNREATDPFSSPECSNVKVVVSGDAEGHVGIIKNWIDAIANGAPLIAPGEEGVKSLELSNAMLLSTWQDNWIDLPIDDDLFFDKLQEKADASSTKP